MREICGTLEDPTLYNVPPLDPGLEEHVFVAMGDTKAPYIDLYGEMTMYERVEWLKIVNRSLLRPMPHCHMLETLSLLTAYNGSMLALFDHCYALRYVRLLEGRFAPGDIRRFLRVHDQSSSERRLDGQPRRP